MLASALTPSSVYDKQKIPACHADGNPTWAQAELHGDVAANGFWSRGTVAIFDVRVTDTDASSNASTDPGKVLKRHEAEKKRKYGPRCEQSNRHFTPLVYSVDGLEGGEAKAARKRLASRLASKWHRNYSALCGFVRARLAFALVRATSRCLRGTRDPTSERAPALEWVAGAGSRLLS